MTTVPATIPINFHNYHDIVLKISEFYEIMKCVGKYGTIFTPSCVGFDIREDY